MCALVSLSAQWTTISCADHFPGAGFHLRASGGTLASARLSSVGPWAYRSIIAARSAHHAPGGIEHHCGQLEPVAHLREGEGVPVRHLPVAGVARRVAAAQVHLGGSAGIGRPAGGDQERETDSKQGSRHGVTLSAARIPALVESATPIALPTALAPGIFDLARMLSRWRSVRESPAVRDLREGVPVQAASRSAVAMKGRLIGSF